MECPSCSKSKLIRRKAPFYHHGIYLGDFDAEVCQNCGEIYFTEKASDAIDRRAVELGVWGLKPRFLTPIRGLPNEMQYFSFPTVVLRPDSATKETILSDITA